MASRAIWAAFQPNGILITINPGFNQMQVIAAAFTLHPKRLTTA
jgi:hypothetical protein